MKGGLNQSSGHVERRLAEMGLLNLMSLTNMTSDENAVIEESDADGFIKPGKSLSEKLSLATSYSIFHRGHRIEKRFVDWTRPVAAGLFEKCW